MMSELSFSLSLKVKTCGTPVDVNSAPHHAHVTHENIFSHVAQAEFTAHRFVDFHKTFISMGTVHVSLAMYTA